VVIAIAKARESAEAATRVSVTFVPGSAVPPYGCATVALKHHMVAEQSCKL
jgi:hypothetical protein